MVQSFEDGIIKTMLEELKKLGLSEKEAKVYLASLELGPESVLKISQRAKIARPTAYVQIESLIGRGLMSSFEKGKKRYFCAESPERLISLISVKEREIKDQRSGAMALLPQLQNIFNLSAEKPRVKFYEEKGGLLSIQEDFLKTKEKNIQAIYNIDLLEKVFTKEERENYTLRRQKKGIQVHSIYTTNKGQVLAPKDEFAERRYIAPDKFPITSDITIYGDKVAIASLQGKLVGVIIESHEIVQTLKSIFYLAWNGPELIGQK